MYIARIDGVFDEYFYDKFIWDEPSEVKKYLMSIIKHKLNIYCFSVATCREISKRWRSI